MDFESLETFRVHFKYRLRDHGWFTVDCALITYWEDQSDRNAWLIREQKKRQAMIFNAKFGTWPP